MKTKLQISLFGKANIEYGQWYIWYVSPKGRSKYYSVTTESKLIDKTFNSENPTQKSLLELRKACKK